MTLDQINSIIEYFDYQAEFFIWQSKNATEDMDENDRAQEYYASVLIPDVIYGDEYCEKTLALMEHAEYGWDQAESEMDNKFKVLTDDEATKAFDGYKENYIDDTVLSQIPKEYHQYFDSEKFVEDCLDDRGAALNSYDGQEYKVTINGTTYYIYKQ